MSAFMSGYNSPRRQYHSQQNPRPNLQDHSLRQKRKYNTSEIQDNELNKLQRAREEKEQKEKEEMKQFEEAISGASTKEIQDKDIVEFAQYLMQSSGASDDLDRVNISVSMAMASFYIRKLITRVQNLQQFQTYEIVEATIVKRDLREDKFKSCIDVLLQSLGGHNFYWKRPTDKNKELKIFGLPLSEVHFCIIYVDPCGVAVSNSFIDLFGLSSDLARDAIKTKIKRQRQTICEGLYMRALNGVQNIVDTVEVKKKDQLDKQSYVYFMTNRIIKKSYVAKAKDNQASITAFELKMNRRMIIIGLHLLIQKKSLFFQINQ